MRPNWINIVIGTIIVALLAWWLWIMGIEPSQKWLLCFVGGGIMEIGVLGGMGMYYDNPRSGVQVKIVFMLMTTIVFLASCIFSFFTFAPESYCIPMGIFALICAYTSIKVYKTKE